MGSKMLIDATHSEETRVVVVRGNRIDEFDFELAARKQLKGNIYLAKVTRVEPSLQAAFVDYGGNRHGFLAFTEIHPDYYQIPIADRQALLRQEEDEARRSEEEFEASKMRVNESKRRAWLLRTVRHSVRSDDTAGANDAGSRRSRSNHRRQSPQERTPAANSSTENSARKPGQRAGDDGSNRRRTAAACFLG